MHPSSGAISTPLTPCTTPSSTRTTPRRRQWYPTTACWSGGAKNAYLLRHFILKMISLPRQARDRHRESTQKETRFSQEDFSELALESWCGDVFLAPFCTILKVTEYLTKTGSGQAMGGTPQKDTFLQDTALSRRRCGRKDKGEKKKKRMRMPL
jgi:hypothetical protein